jgi:hypothetical protein
MFDSRRILVLRVHLLYFRDTAKRLASIHEAGGPLYFDCAVERHGSNILRQYKRSGG